MGTNQKCNRKSEVVQDLRKYIRLQQAGWLILCAWPVGLIVYTYYRRIPTIAERDFNLIVLISFLWIMAAVIIFAIGYTGQKKLNDQEKKHDPEDN